MSLARALLMTGLDGARIGGGGGGGGGAAAALDGLGARGILGSASLRTILQTLMNFFASLA